MSPPTYLTRLRRVWAASGPLYVGEFEPVAESRKDRRARKAEEKRQRKRTSKTEESKR